MNSVSRRKSFIKVKGNSPKRKTIPKSQERQRDDDGAVVGEAAKASSPFIAVTRAASPRSAASTTFTYLLLWSGVIVLVVLLIWAAKHYGGPVRPSADISAAATNEPRRQIGGDPTGLDRGPSGASGGTGASSGSSASGAQRIPTAEGFLAAPLQRGQATTVADARGSGRDAGLKPGDFRRTTCSVQAGDLQSLSAEKLTQCIEDARVR